MGITCKPVGKVKRIFKRLENRLGEERAKQKIKKKEGK